MFSNFSGSKKYARYCSFKSYTCIQALLLFCMWKQLVQFTVKMNMLYLSNKIVATDYKQYY